jgi:hypothetical protein
MLASPPPRDPVGRSKGVTASITPATASCAGPGRAPAAPAAVTPRTPVVAPATILPMRLEKNPAGIMVCRFLHFGSPATCSTGPLTLLPAVTSWSPFSVEKPASSTPVSSSEGLGLGRSTTARTSRANATRTSSATVPAFSPCRCTARMASIVRSSGKSETGISPGSSHGKITGVRPPARELCAGRRDLVAGAP